MTSELKPRRTWPLIVAVLVGVLVLYVLTWPIVSWANRRGWLPQETVRRRAIEAYAYPARLVYEASPPRAQKSIEWYLRTLGD